jgi:sugar lactone lactonase YvrE
MHTTRVLVDEIAFGESPRWHDGRLWLADWAAGEVLVVDPAVGSRAVVARVDAFPFCLAFDGEGRLLIVTGDGRLLRRGADGSLEPVADLGDLSPHPLNELVRHPRGNLFVNGIGYDMAGEDPHEGFVAVLTPAGAVRRVAERLAFPNGMAVTDDGATLIVAESHAGRLTAFTIQPDGALTDRRTWAAVAGSAPDGICLDPRGGLWFGDVPNRCAMRVAEGGAVLDRVDLDRGCFATALGGEDGRTLFLVAMAWGTTEAGRTGQVLTARV